MINLLRLGLVVGSLQASALAKLLTWVGGGEKCPWDGKTETNSHPQKDMPDTGETRYYDFSIARSTVNADGLSRPGIVVNGQFPGPLLEANWGDWLEVNVHNNIYGPEEATTVHYHGLNQPGTPWYDGVVTTAQCPIIPGQNLTYRFRADEYGTSWWHAHISAQYSMGVFGPIVIHGPAEEAKYDVDLGAVIISDWYHRDYKELVAHVTGPLQNGDLQSIRALADSNLVGGVGRFPCENITDGTPCTVLPYAHWNVEPGKTYRMRLVNTGSASFEEISLDGHQMTVIANDFVPVAPYKTDLVKLGVGQRTDIVFTATGTAGQSYWLRAWNEPTCADTLSPDGRGVIAYPGADLTIEPTSTGLTQPPPNPLCANDDLTLTQPAYPVPAITEPDTTVEIHIGAILNPTGPKGLTFLMNNSSFIGDLSSPVLLDAITQDLSSYPTERNVYNLGTNGTVRVILISEFLPPHPMHLHGHDFQVLAQGKGTWDGAITNPSNPQRRDVQSVWFGANASDPNIGTNYVVLQYEQDNPGAWPLHCHIAWHLSAGMNIVMLERFEELMGFDSKVPADVLETCKVFPAWAAAHPDPDPTDSGLRRRALPEAKLVYPNELNS